MTSVCRANGIAEASSVLSAAHTADSEQWIATAADAVRSLLHGAQLVDHVNEQLSATLADFSHLPQLSSDAVHSLAHGPWGALRLMLLFGEARHYRNLQPLAEDLVLGVVFGGPLRVAYRAVTDPDRVRSRRIAVGNVFTAAASAVQIDFWTRRDTLVLAALSPSRMPSHEAEAPSQIGYSPFEASVLYKINLASKLGASDNALSAFEQARPAIKDAAMEVLRRRAASTKAAPGSSS